MHIGIVFPSRVGDYLIYKDPGLIKLGLQQLGHRVSFFSVGSEKSNALSTHIVEENYFTSVDFWQAQRLDLAIVFTWMGRPNLIAAIRQASIPCISKGDTDGLLGLRVHPLPGFVRMVYPPKTIIGKVRAAWHWVKRFAILYKSEDADILQALNLAKLTIIETESAKLNLQRLLTYYKRSSLLEKVYTVPNPVGEHFLTVPIPSKENKIVAIGNWGDRAKNTPLMVRAIKQYMNRRPETKICIIGGGGEQWFKPLVRQYPNVSYTGALSNNNIVQHLASARCCLVTSHWESFHIAGHEAMCMGCTLVGTNINPVRDASRLLFGTVSIKRTPSAIADALDHEMQLWDQGQRDAEEIAVYWRNRLAPIQVAKQIIAIFDEMPQDIGHPMTAAVGASCG